MVEERLDAGHAVALPRLHLRARPVHGVDLGARTDAAEEVIPGAAVVLEESVALDVIDDRLVPPDGLLAFEVPADDCAAALAQELERALGHGAGGDVGVLDHRP